MVTRRFVYNVHKLKVKRQIDLLKLCGVSKNTVGKRSEFTVHVNDEYDYRFLTDKRDEIIAILKLVYFGATQKNLPIFDIPEGHLRGFTSTEKDRKRGVDRFPPDSFRNYEEDLVKEDHAEPKAPDATDGLDLDEGKALRDQQYAATKDMTKNMEEEDPDEDEVKASIAGDMPSQLVF